MRKRILLGFVVAVLGCISLAPGERDAATIEAADAVRAESPESDDFQRELKERLEILLAPRVDASDRQYRTIVSFDTSPIPDGATILSTTLRLRRGTVSGTNPFTTHGACYLDVKTGGFNANAALENADFQALADVVQAGALSNATANGEVSEGALDSAGRAAVNKTGKTQLRVYFSLDDNDDLGVDYIGYYSANNSTGTGPPVSEKDA